MKDFAPQETRVRKASELIESLIELMAEAQKKPQADAERDIEGCEGSL